MKSNPPITFPINRESLNCSCPIKSQSKFDSDTIEYNLMFVLFLGDT